MGIVARLASVLPTAIGFAMSFRSAGFVTLYVSDIMTTVDSNTTGDTITATGGLVFVFGPSCLGVALCITFG